MINSLNAEIHQDTNTFFFRVLSYVISIMNYELWIQIK